MRKILVAGLSLLFPATVLAGELPVKRVVLSTSGLAQFIHGGSVAAGSSIDLPVRLDQVDDLLKSLTIFDREGALGAITLPGKSPLNELFRDLPFSSDALQSPSDLLNALVGSEIEVEGEVTAKGKVFRVQEEETELPDSKGKITRHRLTLLTEKGMVQAILENLSAIRFTEASTKAQIERALAGLAKNRAKERRTLSIGLSGQNTRDVSFSYVVTAPVWKTSYRLVLPKEGGKARLQAFGIVENLSGSDWGDIDLTLISGNPVALKQSLYDPVFVDRPEIAVSTSATAVPGVDEDKRDAGERYMSRRYNKAKAGTIKQAAPPAPQAAMAYSRSREPSGFAQAEELSAAGGVETEETTTQVLYRFPAKVSLSAGSTIMIPFADREITASKTWLYKPEANARRPLAAIRLRNDSETALPPGIVTTFDVGLEGSASFAGDAQLPLMTKGATKFVTFALDGKTEIVRSDRGVKSLRLGKAVGGQLTIETKSTWSIDYDITPPADEDREIIIEETRSGSWKPTASSSDLEETPTRHRYKVAAGKGKTTKATFTRELLEQQTIVLTSLDPDRLYSTISGLENASAALKDTVAKLGVIVADINRTAGLKKELDAERKKISDDQERIRRNLSSVGQGSDLGRRYLDTLRAQEDRLAAISAEEKTIETGLVAKRKAAEDLARALTL